MRHVLKLATAAIVGLALFASLALAQGAAFDVVTMDLRMPGLSGLETLAALRGLGTDARVVVVSGWLAKASRVNLIELWVKVVVWMPLAMLRVRW